MSPLQIGVTGGIGSGKSLVCNIFKKLGIKIYDADSRARLLMQTDGGLIREIKDQFGEEVYLGNQLDRKVLAKMVFDQPEKLTLLNNLVHPKVGEDYRHWLEDEQQSHYVIKEAALLFESGSAKSLDQIVMVSAPESIRIQRVMARDGRTEEAIRKIMDQQMAEEEKVKKADFVVLNDETKLVIPQVLELHDKFLGLVRRELLQT